MFELEELIRCWKVMGGLEEEVMRLVLWVLGKVRLRYEDLSWFLIDR